MLSLRNLYFTSNTMRVVTSSTFRRAVLDKIKGGLPVVSRKRVELAIDAYQ